jgi:hypothetical protein
MSPTPSPAPLQNGDVARHDSRSSAKQDAIQRPAPAAAATENNAAATEWSRKIHAWQNWSKSGYAS